MDELEIKKKLNKVAVLGPHDRMNYGDFLFPLMLDYAFSKELGYNISFKKYSLIKADFSHLGAFSSESFNKLKKDVDTSKIDTIIVAGGESLGATWSRLLSFIYPWFMKLYNMRGFSRYSKFVNFLIKLFFKKCYENPFVIDKVYFKDVRVIYNSVGGLSKNINNLLKNRLSTSNYLALRERFSFHNAVSLDLKNSVLAPDSAIIMSDLYKYEFFTKKNSNKYIFFQISKYKAKVSLQQIASELEIILDNSDCDIVLCPIGIALGHEDHVILEEIHSKFFKNNQRVQLIKDVTIEKIMSLIANAYAYVGTSLHGVITAMSYNVPYIGLNPSQKKVVNYISTWGHEDLKVCHTDDFYQQYSLIQHQYDVIKIKSEELLIIQKKEYYNSIRNMLNIILK